MIENCKDLCDFYCSLVQRVTEFSFELQPDGSTLLSDKIDSHPFESPREEFVEEAADRIQNLFQEEINKRLELNKAGTSFIPLDSS